MASNVNVWVGTGNLTRDPELRQTGGGTAVCGLRLAVNDSRKVDGEWTEVAGYYDVTVWGAQGENCAKYLSKGRPVAIRGRLDYREWTDAEDKKRSAVQIVADQIQFLSSGGPSGGGDSSGSDAASVPSDDIGF